LPPFSEKKGWTMSALTKQAGLIMMHIITTTIMPISQCHRKFMLSLAMQLMPHSVLQAFQYMQWTLYTIYFEISLNLLVLKNKYS
jgi:hypothetical protein